MLSPPGAKIAPAGGKVVVKVGLGTQSLCVRCLGIGYSSGVD